MSALVLASVAAADHSSDNPVLSAVDAFGLTVGTESTGIYGPSGVRGFSPQVAGNVRIDGLYFDQQGSLSNRVIESSTIRVGMSVIDYPFPAPTGIVDYDLRHATAGTPAATVIVDAGPYGNRSVSIDGNLPLFSNALQLPMGASYQVGAPPGPILGSGSNLGYTSNVATLTAAPQWSPNDRLRLRAFVDWQDTRHAQTSPVIFTNAFRPPRIERGFLGQDFAEGRFSYLNYGVTANAKFDSRWSLAAGIFHSVSDTPVSYADLYVNTQPNGLANHVLVGYPDQKSASTSGEIRLTGNFSPANWKQDVVFSLRGRDGVARYGGSDVVDAGEAYIGSGAQVPRPKFAYASRTLDHTQLWSGGVAYQAGRPGLGNIAFGLQHQQYAKSVESPGNLWSHLVDSPWRLYGVAAVQVAKPVSLYSSYTQGFEDSGIAPSSAKNRGAVLPTARTWQVDGGVRIAVTRKVNLIAGLFELDKPYFNLDTNGVDRSLGAQRAKGLELSLAGEIAGNLTLNAGAVIGKVQVLGPKLAAEGVGKNAVGQPHSQFLINVDYGLPFWPAASMDLSVFHFGAVAESVDNSVYAEGVTMYNVGARYKFNVSSARASLRVQVQNITNVYIWNVGYSPGFFQFAPRTIVAYLTVDI